MKAKQIRETALEKLNAMRYRAQDESMQRLAEEMRELKQERVRLEQELAKLQQSALSSMPKLVIYRDSDKRKLEKRDCIRLLVGLLLVMVGLIGLISWLSP